MGCLCSKATKYDDVAVPKLDATRCGPDVQLGVNNRLTGRGAALCNTTVLQDRMYFETRIVSPEGKFCVGLSGAECSLNEALGGAGLPSKAPGGQRSMAFVIESDKSAEQFKPGDIVSVTFDQSDYPTILNFHLNGHDAPFKSITSVRGDMRPAASVERGAVLELVFDEEQFQHSPPPNFFPLMHAREMMGN